MWLTADQAFALGILFGAIAMLALEGVALLAFAVYSMNKELEGGDDA